MSNPDLSMLKLVHRRVGLLVQSGNRLLASVIVLGVAFCLLSVYSMRLLKQPEQALRLQAFMFNYAEFSRVEQQDVALSHQGHSDLRVKPSDPNWDGAIAGASLGLTIGQGIPIIGLVLGPVVGATIGYELDSRI